MVDIYWKGDKKASHSETGIARPGFARAAKQPSSAELERSGRQKRFKIAKHSTLKDLCPEDKGKVKQLIQDLARVGSDKDRLEALQAEERRRFRELLAAVRNEYKKTTEEKQLLAKELLSSKQQLQSLLCASKVPPSRDLPLERDAISTSDGQLVEGVACNKDSTSSDTVKFPLGPDGMVGQNLSTSHCVQGSAIVLCQADVEKSEQPRLVCDLEGASIPSVQPRLVCDLEGVSIPSVQQAATNRDEVWIPNTHTKSAYEIQRSLFNTLRLQNNTQRPLIETQRPLIETQRPLIETTQRPLIETQRPPLIETQRPLIDTQRPLIETQRPLFETQRPLIETQRPLIETTQRPLIDTQRPLIETQRPLIDTQRPLIETQRPLIDTQRPLIETQRPPFETQRSLIETQRPLIKTQGPLVEAQIQSSQTHGLPSRYLYHSTAQRFSGHNSSFAKVAEPAGMTCGECSMPDMTVDQQRPCDGRADNSPVHGGVVWSTLPLATPVPWDYHGTHSCGEVEEVPPSRHLWATPPKAQPPTMTQPPPKIHPPSQRPQPHIGSMVTTNTRLLSSNEEVKVSPDVGASCLVSQEVTAPPPSREMQESGTQTVHAESAGAQAMNHCPPLPLPPSAPSKDAEVQTEVGEEEEEGGKLGTLSPHVMGYCGNVALQCPDGTLCTAMECGHTHAGSLHAAKSRVSSRARPVHCSPKDSSFSPIAKSQFHSGAGPGDEVYLDYHMDSLMATTLLNDLESTGCGPSDPSSVLGRGHGVQGGGGKGGRHGYHVGMDSILDQSLELLTNSATDSHGEGRPLSPSDLAVSADLMQLKRSGGSCLPHLIPCLKEQSYGPRGEASHYTRTADTAENNILSDLFFV